MTSEAGPHAAARLAKHGPADPRRRVCVVAARATTRPRSSSASTRSSRRCCASLDEIRFRILFVDDGSSDGTLELLNAIAARDPHVRVCSLSRNFGHQAAISAGLDLARGDAVIFLDSDLQQPPKLIPELIGRWLAGHDVVLAVREGTADASWFKRLSSDGFYWLFNLLADVKLIRGAADFCLLSRRVCRALQAMPERHRFVRGMIAWAGFSRATVSYQAPPRAGGQPKFTLPRMLRLAGEAICSFTARPLYLAMQAGVAVMLGGAFCLACLLGKALLGHTAPAGWSWMGGLLLLLSGCQLLVTGLVGAYVARVFEQVKSRPLYLLKQRPKGFAAKARMPDQRRAA